jgi:heme-degrading monooxygenase HmoA
VKARFLVTVRLKPGAEQRFLDLYAAMHRRVQEGVPGHIVHQLCRSLDDPLRWIITSEFESVDDWRMWDESSDHREIVRSFRECFEEGSSVAYEVQLESRHATEPS